MPVTTKTTRKRIVLTKTQRLAREKTIIKDLRAGKMSYRQIAAKNGVSLPTVNAKARKAGITRSRRGPTAGRRITRKVTRTTTRKPTMRARAKTRAKAKTRATAKTRTRVTARKKTTRKVTRRKITRRPITRTTRSKDKFNSEFRNLVLSYRPNMSLKVFERLSKMLSKAL